MVFLHNKFSALRGTFVCAAMALLAGCAPMQSAMAPVKSAMAPLMNMFSPAASSDPSGSDNVPPQTLEEAWTKTAETCASQSSVPDASACGALAQRGRTLQCVATEFNRSGITHGYPAPAGLDAWSRCVGDVGRTLADGYYLRHAEIERRTLLCHANLAAAPDARKPEILTRLRQLLGFTLAVDEKRPEPAGFGAVLRAAPVELQRCTTMMALTEPMQAAAAPPRAVIAAPAATTATPVPAGPAGTSMPIETVNESPAEAVKPAPVVKKPVPAKKPVAKVTSS